jgi:hypothetical protein
MGKFACRPLVEKFGNLPVGLWRRNWLICLSAFGGEIIQFENWLIWKWGNGEICLSAYGGEMGKFGKSRIAD